MSPEDLKEILDAMRRVGGEPSSVEAKSGAGGFPTSVLESLVAFANTEGGTVLIGVDEAAGFEVVALSNPSELRTYLVDISRDSITPALMISTEIVEIEGRFVVVAEVPPTSPDLRPVFVTSKGVTNGAYIRTGEGDRRMTHAEVALTYASRTQPGYDREPVAGANLNDLDKQAVQRTLERVRAGSAAFRGIDDNVAMIRLGIVVRVEDDVIPTLAGLLAFGVFPQQFFPQLMITCVAAKTDGNARFEDSVTLRGSIAELISEATSFVRRNLSARAIVSGDGREDRLDYPIESVREAVVNALMHRDYSPTTRGTQVQIELLPDRLIVKSPGGLFGPVTAEDLGDEGISSSRNATLASLLPDAYMPRSDRLVAENRASGIPTMIRAARDSGLPAPLFDSRITSFTVTMNRSELLGPESRLWLSQLRPSWPSTMHEIAMAMLRTGPVNNRSLREWGADRVEAGRVLHDLVEFGYAIREGGRKYATYTLDPSLRPQTGAATTRTAVVNYISAVIRANAFDIAEASGLSRQTVLNRLNELIDEGLVIATGAPRSPNRTYQWVGSRDRGLFEV